MVKYVKSIPAGREMVKTCFMTILSAGLMSFFKLKEKLSKLERKLSKLQGEIKVEVKLFELERSCLNWGRGSLQIGGKWSKSEKNA